MKPIKRKIMVHTNYMTECKATLDAQWKVHLLMREHVIRQPIMELVHDIQRLLLDQIIKNA